MAADISDFARDLAGIIERLVERKVDERIQAYVKFQQTVTTPIKTGAPQNLTEEEVADRLRVSKSCLQKWRRDPEHPLKWFKPSGSRGRAGGRVLYTLASVEAFEEYCQA